MAKRWSVLSGLVLFCGSAQAGLVASDPVRVVAALPEGLVRGISAQMPPAVWSWSAEAQAIDAPPPADGVRLILVRDPLAVRKWLQARSLVTPADLPGEFWQAPADVERRLGSADGAALPVAVTALVPVYRSAMDARAIPQWWSDLKGPRVVLPMGARTPWGSWAVASGALPRPSAGTATVSELGPWDLLRGLNDGRWDVTVAPIVDAVQANLDRGMAVRPLYPGEGGVLLPVLAVVAADADQLALVRGQGSRLRVYRKWRVRQDVIAALKLRQSLWETRVQDEFARQGYYPARERGLSPPKIREWIEVRKWALRLAP